MDDVLASYANELRLKYIPDEPSKAEVNIQEYTALRNRERSVRQVDYKPTKKDVDRQGRRNDDVVRSSHATPQWVHGRR